MSHAVKVAGKTLLVEDSIDDVELMTHVLWKDHLLDHVQIVRDGGEALDYLFCTGAYATRRPSDPPQGDLPGSQITPGQRLGGADSDQG